MRKNNWVVVCLLLTFIFVGFGDKFLPQPLSGASLKTRTAVNQWAASLQFWKPKTNPYARTEKAIEDVEQNTSDKK